MDSAAMYEGATELGTPAAHAQPVAALDQTEQGFKILFEASPRFYPGRQPGRHHS